MIYSKRRSGFSLIEVMVVIAIIAFFALLALPNFMALLAKAKRSEAYVHLRALYTLERAYFAENGSYTTQLQGPKSLNWKPDGKLNYTYKVDSASTNGFTASAQADIDGDGDMDKLTVNETGEITIAHDDLA